MTASTYLRGYALVAALAVSILPGVSIAESSYAEPNASHKEPNAYQQRNLVSDGAIPAEHTDPNLVNPWGLAFNPFGVFWVADNHTGKSTLYDGNGVPQSLVVTIPPAADAGGPSSPTGIVFNGSDGFVVHQGDASGPARFIFATESGTIAAWSPAVDLHNAFLVMDNTASGAIYKGLAMAGNGTEFFLYATDFHNGRIDVFNSSFQPTHLSGCFEDPAIPEGFAPFGIQNIHGNLYVTYAKQDADREDDVPGRGFGFVDVFDADGHLLKRLISRGRLNAPWGLALAPSGFGKFSNRLLVGNFGNGIINAYDVATGEWVGRLHQPDGHTLRIEGLWGLSFGNGVAHQPTHTLFFTAGPDDENHGLYGRLDAAPSGHSGLVPEREDEDN